MTARALQKSWHVSADIDLWEREDVWKWSRSDPWKSPNALRRGRKPQCREGCSTTWVTGKYKK